MRATNFKRITLPPRVCVPPVLLLERRSLSTVFIVIPSYAAEHLTDCVNSTDTAHVNIATPFNPPERFPFRNGRRSRKREPSQQRGTIYIIHRIALKYHFNTVPASRQRFNRGAHKKKKRKKEKEEEEPPVSLSCRPLVASVGVELSAFFYFLS